MNKRFKLTIIILISVLLIIVTFILGRMKYYIHVCEGLVYPGISINEIDISFLNREQALSKVSSTLKQINANKIIKVQVDEKSYETTFAELRVAENIEEIVDLALNYGKKDGFFNEYKYITKGVNRNFKTYITLDDDKYLAFVKIIEKEQNKSSINALIDHEWSGFTVTPHELGRSLDIMDLRRDIKETIEAGEGDEIIIVNGNFIVEYPRILEENLKTIDTLIGSYTTSFSSSSFGRSHNIELAAKYCNNAIIMPGEEFSFNKVVGAATSGKGYSYAKVIKNGAYVDEIGGGVCQVSSTLFNAVLKTKLEITERRNHSKLINYVPIGRDAMISYGVSDFKFINNYDYPILIESIIVNKNITFNLYCNKSEKGQDYEIITEKVKDIKAKKEVIYDYGLSEGTVIVQQEGKNGQVVNTYRVLYENGKEKERIFVGESIYAAKNSIVRVGKD